MVQVMCPVIFIDGEEWLVDQSMILTSNPPQYNIYRLSDKKHSYKFCHEVNPTTAIRFMSLGEVYEFLNPGSTAVTIIGNSTSGTIIFGANNDKKD